MSLAQRYNALSIERCKGVEVEFKQKAAGQRLHFTEGQRCSSFVLKSSHLKWWSGPKTFTYKHLHPGLLGLVITSTPAGRSLLSFLFLKHRQVIFQEINGLHFRAQQLTLVSTYTLDILNSKELHGTPSPQVHLRLEKVREKGRFQRAGLLTQVISIRPPCWQEVTALHLCLGHTSSSFSCSGNRHRRSHLCYTAAFCLLLELPTAAQEPRPSAHSSTKEAELLFSSLPAPQPTALHAQYPILIAAGQWDRQTETIPFSFISLQPSGCVPSCNSGSDSWYGNKWTVTLPMGFLKVMSCLHLLAATGFIQTWKRAPWIHTQQFKAPTVCLNKKDLAKICMVLVSWQSSRRTWKGEEKGFTDIKYLQNTFRIIRS